MRHARLPPLGIRLLAGLAWFAAAPHAFAGQDSFSVSEVTLRLVAKAPEADGTVRAALLIELSPGWKTYWIDPGEAGIPPRIHLGSSLNLAETRLGFPMPHRFGDEYGMSNGYGEPTSFAITSRQTVPGDATELRASIMLGVCQAICIPISAELTARPGSGGADAAASVDAAFAALPQAGDAQAGIDSVVLSPDRKTLAVEAHAPAAGNTAPDLFVTGPKGWSFGAPEPVSRNGTQLRFTVPVLGHPRAKQQAPIRVDALMTLGGGTGVTGTLETAAP